MVRLAVFMATALPADAPTTGFRRHVVVITAVRDGVEPVLDMAWFDATGPWSSCTWRIWSDGRGALPEWVPWFVQQRGIDLRYEPLPAGPVWLGAGDCPAASEVDDAVWLLWLPTGEKWTWDVAVGRELDSGAGKVLMTWYRDPGGHWGVQARLWRWPAGQPWGVDALARGPRPAPWWGPWWGVTDALAVEAAAAAAALPPWNRRVEGSASWSPVDADADAAAPAGAADADADAVNTPWPRPLWGRLPGVVGRALLTRQARGPRTWSETPGWLWRCVAQWSTQCLARGDVDAAVACGLWAEGLWAVQCPPDQGVVVAPWAWCAATPDAWRAYQQAARAARYVWLQRARLTAWAPMGYLTSPRGWRCVQRGAADAPWTWRFAAQPPTPPRWQRCVWVVGPQGHQQGLVAWTRAAARGVAVRAAADVALRDVPTRIAAMVHLWVTGRTASAAAAADVSLDLVEAQVLSKVTHIVPSAPPEAAWDADTLYVYVDPSSLPVDEARARWYVTLVEATDVRGHSDGAPGEVAQVTWAAAQHWPAWAAPSLPPPLERVAWAQRPPSLTIVSSGALTERRQKVLDALRDATGVPVFLDAGGRAPDVVWSQVRVWLRWDAAWRGGGRDSTVDAWRCLEAVRAGVVVVTVRSVGQLPAPRGALDQWVQWATPSTVLVTVLQALQASTRHTRAAAAHVADTRALERVVMM